MDTIKSYQEIVAKLANAMAKQIEIKDNQSETQQVQNAIAETKYLSSLPITRNYLQTRRDKLSQEFNSLIIERDRSLNEGMFMSLCLFDNEISKNINPISSYG